MSKGCALASFDKPAISTPLWIDVLQLALEAQTVIVLKMAGMMGIMAQDPGEPFLMLMEKQAALAESLYAVAQAAGEGASPDRVIAAGLRPFGNRIRANSCRLVGTRSSASAVRSC